MFFLDDEQQIPAAFEVEPQDFVQLQQLLGSRDRLEALLHTEVAPLVRQWTQQLHAQLTSPKTEEQIEARVQRHLAWWRAFFMAPRDQHYIQQQMTFGAECAANEIQLSDLLMLMSQISLKLQQTLFLNASEQPGPSVHALFCKLNAVDISLLTRTYEQNQETEQLQKRNDGAHTTFLANMSHELRTPLNAIIGFTRILNKTTLTRSQDNYVRKIRTSSESLLDLVNDILDFSKIEAGKLKLENIPFNIFDVLDELAELFSNQAHQKELELLILPTPQLPPKLIGDPFRLRQILINLMSNALKFTHEGHIQLKVSPLHKTSREVVLRFVVEDTGVGIPPSKLKHIFGSFAQADESTTRQFGGTGLGLTISKQLAELMGGTIGADSVIGQGTNFWIELPFDIAKVHTTTTQTKIPLKLHRLKTLIVDDHELSLQHLYELCDAFGLQVTALDDSEEALHALNDAAHEGQPFGLVLLDWRMPKYDGLELAHIIRESPGLEETPIILLTAFGMEEQRLQGESIGLNAFLTKPVQRSVLYKTLKDIFTPNVAPSAMKKNQLATRDKLRRQKARQSKILVAEDNALNQEVIYSVLTEEGFQVELADDGLAVLEKLDTGDYDLLLLDIQMPKLDGYKTAAAVRNDERFQDLPIIAVTAHAMKGDKEKCLQAGMNDYLTKPLQFDHLIAALHYWLSRGQDFSSGDSFDIAARINTIELTQKRAVLPRPSQLSRPESPPPPSRQLEGIDPALLHLVHFDASDALARMRGDQALYRRLLHKLLAEHSQDHTKIRASIDGCCFSLAYEQVHKLKGIASNLSMVDVARAAVRLEQLLTPLYQQQEDTQEAAPTIDLSSLLSALQRFELSYDAALQELSKALQPKAQQASVTPTPTGSAEPPDDAETDDITSFAAAHKAALQHLREASFLGDIDEVSHTISQLPQDAPETQTCRALLDEFDLEAIHTLIGEWLNLP